jgi:ABC-type Zn uptake system ZnuABC Zn-binding protein ZnuA
MARPRPDALRPLRRAARPLVALSALALAVLAAGCGGGSDRAGAGRSGAGALAVVATTTQLGDVVAEVGGRAVSVHRILRPNTDPHEYEPRPDDVVETAGAKIVFESGDRLDAWMDKVVAQAGGSPRVLVMAPAHTPHRLPGPTSGPEAARFDPHWWHDPRNVEAIVPVIRDALTRANPSARSAYAANARAYLRRLRRLDAGIARCVSAVPVAQRRLVTDHDAFGYFARRYEIDVVGAVIPSQTTQAQPSARAVARLVRLIEAEHVHAVFPESSVNPKLARAIARQTGASSSAVLYGDTLGPAGSPGATYLAMEAHNADAMVRGFTDGRRGCAIPGLR